MTEPRSGGVDFKNFAASIAATAAATLSHVRSLLAQEAPEGEPPGEPDQAGEADKPTSPEERDAMVRTGLQSARQLVDTLVLLEEKTKGNLTGEEQKLLQAYLTDLRIQYVRVLDQSKAQAKES